MGKKRKFNGMAINSHKYCCKCHEEEHRKRWEEYRNSQSSTDGSSQCPPYSERDIWVQGNLSSKGHVYGFGAEKVVMKQQSCLSVSTRSSAVNNYDAREMAMRLNDSVNKAAKDVRQEDFLKQIEEDVRGKLVVEFGNKLAEMEAKFENELAQAKAARQRDKKKVKSKMSKLWTFLKSQQAGSSTILPNTTPLEDDGEDEPDTTKLGGSSHD